MNMVFQECTPKGHDMVPPSQASSFCDWYKNHHKTSAPKRLIVNLISVRSVCLSFFNWVLWWWGWDPLERPRKVNQLSPVAFWFIPSWSSGTGWSGSRCYLGKKESSLVSFCGTLVISQKFRHDTFMPHSSTLTSHHGHLWHFYSIFPDASPEVI